MFKMSLLDMVSFVFFQIFCATTGSSCSNAQSHQRARNLLRHGTKSSQSSLTSNGTRQPAPTTNPPRKWCLQRRATFPTTTSCLRKVLQLWQTQGPMPRSRPGTRKLKNGSSLRGLPGPLPRVPNFTNNKNSNTLMCQDYML